MRSNEKAQERLVESDRANGVGGSGGGPDRLLVGEVEFADKERERVDCPHHPQR